MKYKQELSPKIEKKLDDYIERIRVIKWFSPSPDLKREEIDRKVNFALETFGLKASIEYRSLKTDKDWDAARDAALDAARDATWGAARDVAWDAARDAVLDAARDAAWDAARDVAWGAARDAARGADDLLVEDLENYKKKYPNGSFINLIPLWEAGLYPIGIVNGKFLVYVPPTKLEFPKEFQ